MSQDARLDTFELVVRAPVLGDRVSAVAKTLRAVDRLYTIAALVDQPTYRDRLAEVCRFPAPDDPAARRLPEPLTLAHLGRVIEDEDRLCLEEFAEEDVCRFVLTGMAHTVADLREYLGNLGDPAWLAGGATDRTAWALPSDHRREDHWRRRTLTLDVAPWFRGGLLAILHRTLNEVRSAAATLIEDAARSRAETATRIGQREAA